jgi:hypothetical protein
VSRRTRSRRRAVTQQDRDRFLRRLAEETGQPVEEVVEHVREAVRLGWLIETPDGWQAAIPVDAEGQRGAGESS